MRARRRRVSLGGQCPPRLCWIERQNLRYGRSSGDVRVRITVCSTAFVGGGHPASRHKCEMRCSTGVGIARLLREYALRSECK